MLVFPTQHPSARTAMPRPFEIEFDQALDSQCFSGLCFEIAMGQVRLPKHGRSDDGALVLHKPWFMPQLKWNPLDITLVHGLHYIISQGFCYVLMITSNLIVCNG